MDRGRQDVFGIVGRDRPFPLLKTQTVHQLQFATLHLAIEQSANFAP
jgi:hypothetical protein